VALPQLTRWRSLQWREDCLKSPSIRILLAEKC
jgi:hypothetical protein